MFFIFLLAWKHSQLHFAGFYVVASGFSLKLFTRKDLLGDFFWLPVSHNAPFSFLFFFFEVVCNSVGMVAVQETHSTGALINGCMLLLFRSRRC